jgi:hypothetical protein
MSSWHPSGQQSGINRLFSRLNISDRTGLRSEKKISDRTEQSGLRNSPQKLSSDRTGPDRGQPRAEEEG